MINDISLQLMAKKMYDQRWRFGCLCFWFYRYFISRIEGREVVFN